MKTKLSKALPELKQIAKEKGLKLNRVKDFRIITEEYKRKVLLCS